MTYNTFYTYGRLKEIPVRAREANTARSKVRARVEHVFGHMTTSMGGKFLRTIGLARARTKIGAMNVVYNMSRLASLRRSFA